MFVDEITLEAKAGRGGDGVVRWRQEKFVDRGGPVGGNGGRGGDVYMRAVRDLGLLSRYTGAKAFSATPGESGGRMSRHGRAGEDMYIDVPVGSKVTHIGTERMYTFTHEGEVHKILKGGNGGLGNEHFKSAINRSPENATKGKKGETGNFFIELSLVVDVGIIGLPNAGKSTLLNALTRAHSRVGAYPFTTTEPHLGDLYGRVLADIPGLIEGASEGKGLGHKFLRHVTRTKMLMHCVSLENENYRDAYDVVKKELEAFDVELAKKYECIVLTKADLAEATRIAEARHVFAETGKKTYVVSASTGEGIKELSEALLREVATHGQSE